MANFVTSSIKKKGAETNTIFMYVGNKYLIKLMKKNFLDITFDCFDFLWGIIFFFELY